MSRPNGISLDRLREALNSVEGKRATLRIVVGINHKNGVPQATLADWYGVSRTTIHNWLTRLERLETEPIETVVYDDQRPGRPTKLAERHRRELQSALSKSPEAVGYESDSWSPTLVQSFVREEFDVEYSLRHIRTLMHDAGVEWDARLRRS